MEHLLEGVDDDIRHEEQQGIAAQEADGLVRYIDQCAFVGKEICSIERTVGDACEDADAQQLVAVFESVLEVEDDDDGVEVEYSYEDDELIDIAINDDEE